MVVKYTNYKELVELVEAAKEKVNPFLLVARVIKSILSHFKERV